MFSARHRLYRRSRDFVLFTFVLIIPCVIFISCWLCFTFLGSGPLKELHSFLISLDSILFSYVFFISDLIFHCLTELIQLKFSRFMRKAISIELECSCTSTSSVAKCQVQPNLSSRPCNLSQTWASLSSFPDVDAWVRTLHVLSTSTRFLSVYANELEILVV